MPHDRHGDRRTAAERDVEHGTTAERDTKRDVEHDARRDTGHGAGHSMSEAVLRALLSNTDDIVFIKDVEGRYQAVSKPFLDAMEKTADDEVVGMTDADLLTDTALIEQYAQEDMQVFGGEPLVDRMESVSTKDDISRYVVTSKYPIADETGAVIGLYGVGRDATAEHEVKVYYDHVLQSMFEFGDNTLAACLLDVTDWCIRKVQTSERGPELLSPDDTIESYCAKTVEAIVEGEDARRFLRSFSQESVHKIYGGGTHNLLLEYLRNMPDDTMCWVREEFYFLTDPDNGHLSVMVILRDIDAMKRVADELVRAADRDPLTGLLDYEAAMRHIKRFLNEEGATGVHALFMIDIDDFGSVNDTFGRQVGDSVLADIADMIRLSFRSADIVGRVSGDEFLVLMKNVASPRTLRRKACLLIDDLNYTHSTESMRVELSGSVGIALCSGDSKTLAELYAEADAALYRAKVNGKNRFYCAAQSDRLFEMETLANHEPDTLHLRTLLENMNGALFITEISDDIKISYASQSLFTIMKHDPHTVGHHGENILSVILPEDMPELRRSAFYAARTNTALDYTYRARGADGGIEWHHIHGVCLPRNADGVCQMVNVVSDVTSQKHHETEIREKQGILEFAIRDTDVALWFYDVNTRECTLSENYKRIHNIRDNVLQEFPECLSTMGHIRDDSSSVLDAAYRNLRENGDDFDVDVWFRTADGSGWWCERESVTCIFDDAGAPVRAIGIGKSIAKGQEGV